MTIIQGWDSRMGVVLGATAASFVLPLVFALWGGVAAFIALLVCLLLGFGWGYRLLVTPGGIVFYRTCYGVPWRRQQLLLHVELEEYSTFEHPDAQGLVLKSEPPVILPASEETVGELRRVVEEAVERASRGTLPPPPHA